MVDKKALTETKTYLYSGNHGRGNYLLTANMPMNMEEIYSTFFSAEKKFPDWEVVGAYSGRKYVESEKWREKDNRAKIYSSIVVHADAAQIMQIAKQANEGAGVKLNIYEHFVIRVLERPSNWNEAGEACRGDMLRNLSDLDKGNTMSKL